MILGAILFAAAVGSATVTADRIAVDNVTKAAVASGNVEAKYGKVTVRSEKLERRADGIAHFDSSTSVTTCSNAVGHTHWNVSGEVEYKEDDYVILRDAWLTLYEIPVFWLPYLYYPLDTKCGFSWMVGYTGRWGAYLMTKYRYHLIGDPAHADDTWWLRGASRLDLRTKNGVALGEDLNWNLGDFGAGKFKAYYAWDEEYDRIGNSYHGWNTRAWGSDIDRRRYGLSLDHLYEATERDTVRVRGAIYSDSYFRHDFYRRSMFTLKNQFAGYDNSAVFWEHTENSWAFGAEVSGRLNDFYGLTERLPELYLDFAPHPVFSLPVNYESGNSIGWLRRRYASNAIGDGSVLGSNPGLWADYETLRFDTYHRLTAPFKFADDVVSAVPRLGYHGTFWHDGGMTDTTGRYRPVSSDEAISRSIVEAGATFSARGTGTIDNRWSHLIEPYFDVLGQEAFYDGLRSGSRPYVFDAVDAARTWDDQFAGRGRNLPYTYYGVTPGLRNAWSLTDEKGNTREIVDVDIYAALQFNDAEWERTAYGVDELSHRLAEPGSPNFGRDGGGVVPGGRIRWRPSEDITIAARAEYDSERSRIALGELVWKHRVSEDFDYYIDYRLTDSRVWDFSSTPFDSSELQADEFNWAKHNYGEAGFTCHPVDWFAMSPFVRWDFRTGSLDTAGAWFDYLTDCLGFRFVVEFEDSYTRIDGMEYDEDWDFQFQVYLRAFGFDGNSIFGK